MSYRRVLTLEYLCQAPLRSLIITVVSYPDHSQHVFAQLIKVRLDLGAWGAQVVNAGKSKEFVGLDGESLGQPEASGIVQWDVT